VESTQSATFSCQALVDNACPRAALASAQACRSDNECPSGSCQLWDCAGDMVEACTNPLTELCNPAGSTTGGH
jgi:hypothetical protein